MKILSLVKLQMAGLLKFGDGVIKVFNQRFGMLPISYFMSLAKYFSINEKKKDLYLISWINGLIVMKYFHLSTKSKNPVDLYTIGMDYASLLGFGGFKTLEYDVGKFALFQVPNDPFINYEDDIESFQLVIAGFQGGGGSIAHSNLINCVLIDSQKNANVSVFLNATRDELVKRNLVDKFEKFVGDSIENIEKYQKNLFYTIKSMTKVEELKVFETKKLPKIIEELR